MTRKKLVPGPVGLGASGTALWQSIAGSYVLRPDEKVTLEAACRASDRIAAMRTELGDTIMTTGSMGQDVVHPLIAEIRAHEVQVAGLLAKLKLPDEAGSEQVSQQRAAAQSRWASAHGAAS